MEPPCVTIRCHISVGDSVRAWYEMAEEALQGVAAAKNLSFQTPMLFSAKEVGPGPILMSG
jgi:hypothetical protein